MAMFCCALADYDWVEHISSTRAIVRTRMITCENPSVHFREKRPRTVPDDLPIVRVSTRTWSFGVWHWLTDGSSSPSGSRATASDNGLDHHDGRMVFWLVVWLFGCLVYNKMIYCVKVFWNLSTLACDLYALHAPVRMPFLPVVSMLG
jgi:hypothetical protein